MALIPVNGGFAARGPFIGPDRTARIVAEIKNYAPKWGR